MRTLRRNMHHQRFTALSPRVASLALELVKSYVADYAAYREAAIASTYDSRGRRTYRERFCEHGASRWTDYDNICGGCEDGITMSGPRQRYERAIAEAKHRFETHDAIMTTVRLLNRCGIDVDSGAAVKLAASYLDVHEYTD